MHLVSKYFLFFFYIMAKKIKQKKSGMIRRQQQKRKKKMMQRRLAMPQKRTQQNNSQQNIEQLLSTLPTLAYEPELTDLRMSESEFGKLLENNYTEIEIFMALITEKFLVDLEKRLIKLEELNPEKSIKSLLAQATRHQIANNEKIPHLSNPLLITIFLKTRASIEGTSLDLTDLPAAMEEFNQRNDESIRNITENYKDDNEKNRFAEPDNDKTFQKESTTIDPSVYKKYLELIPKNKHDQVEEDLDVFLVDFKPPPVAEWNLNLIKKFISEWFVENANPTNEDLESMRESLLNLFQYLTEEKLLSEKFLEEASQYLNSP